MITPAVPPDPAAAAQIASLQVERAALVSAIASGAKTVSYEGKNVSYDDLPGMKMRLSFIDAQIALLSGTSTRARKPQAGMATFRRGYNTRSGAGYGGLYGFG